MAWHWWMDPNNYKPLEMSHAYHSEKLEDDDEPLKLIDIILFFAGIGVIVFAAWLGWESVNWSLTI